MRGSASNASVQGTLSRGKEIEIWKVCKLCLKGKIYMSTSSRELRRLGQFLTPKPSPNRLQENKKADQLSEVDHVPTNTHSSQGESQLYIFEDNEAVINMIIKEWPLICCNQLGTKDSRQLC